MAAEWYYRVMGAEFGPVSANELVEQAADRKISPDTEVRKGDGAWVPASRVAGLFDRASQSKGTTAKSAVPPPLPDQDASLFVPASVSSTPSSSKIGVIDTAEDDRFRVEILLSARQLVRRSSTQATFRTGSGSWRSGSSRS
jgi:hypothetical protein